MMESKPRSEESNMEKVVNCLRYHMDNSSDPAVVVEACRLLLEIEGVEPSKFEKALHGINNQLRRLIETVKLIEQRI